MRDRGREEKSGRGRHRGIYHSDEELIQEARAKGARKSIDSEPGMAHEMPKQESKERLLRQKGYGANQQQEGESRHTQRGTRAVGGEHG